MRSRGGANPDKNWKSMSYMSAFKKVSRTVQKTANGYTNYAYVISEDDTTCRLLFSATL